MPELTHKDRRTALNFASALEFMAEGLTNPFDRKAANRLIHQIRMRYRFSSAEKKEIIIASLQQGCSSINEIVEETGFPEEVVYVLVRELADEKPPRLRFERVSSPNGRGRRAVRIFLARVNSLPLKNK
jgi:hypothetical protein